MVRIYPKFVIENCPEYDFSEKSDELVKLEECKDSIRRVEAELEKVDHIKMTKIQVLDEIVEVEFDIKEACELMQARTKKLTFELWQIEKILDSLYRSLPENLEHLELCTCNKPVYCKQDIIVLQNKVKQKEAKDVRKMEVEIIEFMQKSNVGVKVSYNEVYIQGFGTVACITLCLGSGLFLRVPLALMSARSAYVSYFSYLNVGCKLHDAHARENFLLDVFKGVKNVLIGFDSTTLDQQLDNMNFSVSDASRITHFIFSLFNELS